MIIEKSEHTDTNHQKYYYESKEDCGIPKSFHLYYLKMIHALVHTQGVVLGRTYLPLELAYQDVLGVRAHFHIVSPLNYSKMRRLYPHARPDVTVVTEGGTPYSEVLAFLKMRFRYLSSHFPHVMFGYKGECYQPQVLNDAGIPHKVNIETFGVPTLQKTLNSCRWHKGSPSKCAVAALDQMLRHAV